MCLNPSERVIRTTNQRRPRVGYKAVLPEWGNPRRVSSLYHQATNARWKWHEAACLCAQLFGRARHAGGPPHASGTCGWYIFTDRAAALAYVRAANVGVVGSRLTRAEGRLLVRLVRVQYKGRAMFYRATVRAQWVRYGSFVQSSDG